MRQDLNAEGEVPKPLAVVTDVGAYGHIKVGERTLAVEYRPASALIPFAKNARTHSDAQVAQIAASIREFGWTNPILVDGDNGIIAGHGRLLAARKLGMGAVPVIELAGLSEAQKRALIIADNKLDHGHCGHAKFASGKQPTMPGNDAVVAIDQDRVRPPELTDRRSDLRHLRIRVRACVIDKWDQGRGRAVID